MKESQGFVVKRREMMPADWEVAKLLMQVSTKYVQHLRISRSPVLLDAMVQA